MILNINIGLLGHVDSGKTSLAKTLSCIASTAAYDKDPQSQSRGMTLDLGFSAFRTSDIPKHLQQTTENYKELQLTFVDCPGHASLIKTAICGAQIIDLMLLVVDVTKGIQTQTAECLVIAEILQRKLIIVLNKTDLLLDNSPEALEKIEAKYRKTFAKTTFGANLPIFCVSTYKFTNIQLLLDGIMKSLYLPERDISKEFYMYVDHCFSIKGQGTVLTGTIMQGHVACNDTIEIPQLGEARKVKQIQTHHQQVNKAIMGDRIGLCVTQFNAQQLERSVICKPGYLRPVFAIVIHVNLIDHYKYAIKSGSKLHTTMGYETVLGSITLFKSRTGNEQEFDVENEYEFVESIEANLATDNYFALIELNRAVYAAKNSKVIVSKLDDDISKKKCRLACWGNVSWHTCSVTYAKDDLVKFHIYKFKSKEGYVQRIVDNNYIIIDGLFEKGRDRCSIMGMQVHLSTGEIGKIESSFGKTSKMKVYIEKGLQENTKNVKISEIKVILNFKKHIFNKQKTFIQ